MTQLGESTDTGEDAEYRYSTDWIHEFEGEPHWRLYWRQQRLMRDLVRRDDYVLEIGIGTGFTTNYLRSKHVSVRTLDIDPGKRPDIVANVARYDFPEAYDAILAFEIFEHIPYEEFSSVLAKLSTAARRNVFLSVPRNRKTVFSIRAKFPKLKVKSFELKVRKRGIDEPYHMWEVDHGGITVDSLEQVFARHRFEIHRCDEAFDRLFYALACPPMRRKEK